jgi:hypothetical protein
MNSKEKAIEIYNKFYGIPLYIKTIKQSCNIVIDEIMQELTALPYGLEYLNRINYWLEVKEEINNL